MGVIIILIRQFINSENTQKSATQMVAVNEFTKSHAHSRARTHTRTQSDFYYRQEENI